MRRVRLSLSPMLWLVWSKQGEKAKKPSDSQRYRPLPQHANVKPFFKSDGSPLSPAATQLIRLFLDNLLVSSRLASIDHRKRYFDIEKGGTIGVSDGGVRQATRFCHVRQDMSRPRRPRRPAQHDSYIIESIPVLVYHENMN